MTTHYRTQKKNSRDAVAKSLRDLKALFGKRPPPNKNASRTMTGADTTLLTSKPNREVAK